MQKDALRPTDAELDVLGILWSHGPCTVKQVHELLTGKPKRGYTTILKLMQIMCDKRLVTRRKQGRAHVYQARVSAEKTRRSMLSHLIDKAFDGSAARLIMQALTTGSTTEMELEEIRRLLERKEGEQS